MNTATATADNTDVRPVRLVRTAAAEDVRPATPDVQTYNADVRPDVSPDNMDVRADDTDVSPDVRPHTADVRPDNTDVQSDNTDVRPDVSRDARMSMSMSDTDGPTSGADAEDVPPTVADVRVSDDARVQTSMSVADTNRQTSGADAEDVRAALAEMPSQAAAVRYACERVRPLTNANVRDWLSEHGRSTDASYAGRLVNAYRKEHGMSDTGALPVMTPDVLASLAPTLAPPVAERIDTAIDTGVADADAGPIAPEATDAETEALRARVASARGQIPLQADRALLDVLSPEEMQAERELEEELRAADREIRRRTKSAELSRAKRAQATEDEIARAEGKDSRWHRRALAARRRMGSADARLAQLYKRAEWSSRALVAVVVLGMVWSGVNVQRNLVPSGDMADPLYWLSYGIEAMISVPIITIMVVATTAARWGKELKRGGVIVAELGLLSVTVALNAGPHIASQHWGKAGEFAIAPVMVGVVIWLHSWVSGAYARLITDAEDVTSTAPTGA